MVYRAWNAHVKHGKDKWLQQQATKVEQITLMRQDWEFILDFAEKCPDNDLQLLLISVVDMCYGLEALAELYWQLIALNDLVENAENANFHLPESFVKRWQICFRRYRCAPTEPDCCTPPLCANTLFAGCGREIEAVNIDS